MKKKFNNLGIGAFLICIMFTSCKKFVQVSAPNTGLVSESVFASDESAAGAVTAIYAAISNHDFADGMNSISFGMGLYSDELTNYSSPNSSQPAKFYQNAFNKTDDIFFSTIYHDLYLCNAAINGITSSQTLSPALKKQLLGESKFMRALFLFYAVNLYGEIPLVTTPDYRINNTIKRSNVDEVYNQIVEDLQEAKINLSDDFLNSAGYASPERIRPNKGAATALLARTYLYRRNWVDAENQSTALISDNLRYDTVSLDQVFKVNNKEAIFQLQSTSSDLTTVLSGNFVFREGYFPGNSTSAALAGISPQLKDAFEDGDNRFNLWVGKYSNGVEDYFYPNKYQQITGFASHPEYMTVLRLAEQYLIRAEARVQQGNFGGAKADINIIRKRAGLKPIIFTEQSALLASIAHERQVELFSEWGDRWFDLKRTGKLSDLMKVVAPSKGGIWADYKILLPIPQTVIDQNPNLTQNPNY